MVQSVETVDACTCHRSTNLSLRGKSEFCGQVEIWRCKLLQADGSDLLSQLLNLFHGLQKQFVSFSAARKETA